ncbi:MAG: acyl transferase, partial [Taibaiella sp.]|nr:acyl transferase [Taibaiella sp.]
GNYTILALLPSYLERPNSSLVFMAAELMKDSAMPGNHFYINELDELAAKLKHQEGAGKQTLLIGVTFALVDFALSHPAKLERTIVMETGGMKGKREEWTRNRLHSLFTEKWQLKTVHSEYGMTEMLSQAYSSGNGIYKCTNTMRVYSREINDPLSTSSSGQGCINVIDLANIHSCSFIATEDTGTIYSNGDFEISGRLDHSALRGCSLMAL